MLCKLPKRLFFPYASEGRRGFARSMFSLLMVAILSASVAAQDEDDAKKDEPPPIPEPEDVVLDTKDGVQLACTYYGGNRGKGTVPVIILHDWEGSRGQYDVLARQIQSTGNAVIVPDLRGHGGSTTQRGAGGAQRELDLKRFTVNDIGNVVLQDIPAVKRFLLEKNNAGELNIEQLCVVGVGFGSLAALNWSAYDWSRPAVAAIKIGRDVKALVLITPEQNRRGLSAMNALKHPIVRSKLSKMLITAKRSGSSYSDDKRLHNTLKRAHPVVNGTPEVVMDKKDLFFIEMDTALTGDKLVANQSTAVTKAILQFIKLRLVNKATDLQWRDRSNPLGN